MGKVRKVHLLLLAPDLEAVEKINTKLAGVGNLRSDGRPILGMDVKLFLRMIADACPRCTVIPSHIWTPWFSLFGANSGFDAIEECFEEMTPFIFALETGLSSDPPMNRRLSALDRYALVSNSDAHSPSKIGREANVFDAEFSYAGLIGAIRSKDPSRFLHTVEFFPEEGKYHYDGHRKCGVVLAPGESLARNDLCPKCGKKLTIGVMHRVEELADRRAGDEAPVRTPFLSLIPLNEIVAEALGKTPGLPERLGRRLPVHPRVRERIRGPDRGPGRGPVPRRPGAGRRGRGPDAEGPGPDRSGTRRGIRRPSACSTPTRTPRRTGPRCRCSERGGRGARVDNPLRRPYISRGRGERIATWKSR